MLEVGTRVRYIREDAEWKKATGWYPPVGTLGTVREDRGCTLRIHWDSGTKGDGIWACEPAAVEVVHLTVYERILQMSKSEIATFLYWVYMCGNEDGKRDVCDSDEGYFGGKILDQNANELMPTGDVEDDLWSTFEKIYKGA